MGTKIYTPSRRATRLFILKKKFFFKYLNGDHISHFTRTVGANIGLNMK